MKTLRIAARILALACLGFIAFATLSPIGLRPVVAGLQTEHLVAFLVLGLLFGIGFPRHLLPAALLVVGAAVVLEALQNLVQGRHGRLIDMDVKIGGAVLGFLLAAAVNGAVRRALAHHPRPLRTAA